MKELILINHSLDYTFDFTLMQKVNSRAMYKAKESGRNVVVTDCILQVVSA